MQDDREIARSRPMLPIEEIAEKIGIAENLLEKYGLYKAKIKTGEMKGISGKPGKLVLVTAMSPTPAGEGKTTTSIGLADALSRLGKKTIVALREPSLGPVFGMKGGATGGGYAQVMPREEINLHFTGDIHAVTSAHNLLAAMVDNRLHFDGSCGLMDVRRVTWKRVLDMDDRVLREVVVGIGGPLRGIARETGFDITAASEVMAVLCLSNDLQDLRERLGRMVIGYSPDGELIFAKDIKAHGAMTALLKDAIKPNIVQTLEGTPAFIHGGPFANIAHGTSSVIAARMALDLGEIVVTECGFGSDLGAEKFFDVVLRSEQVPPPDAVVLVATVRALKYHGGVSRKELEKENIPALEKGFVNLEKHIDNLRMFGVPLVVAINRFPTDTGAEIEKVRFLCRGKGVRAALSEVFSRGGEGGEELAGQVLQAVQQDPKDFHFLYPLDMPLLEKIETVATKIYGAAGVAMEGKISRKISGYEKKGFGRFPVCIAKTQYSLSDDDQVLGRPEGFTLIVTDASLSSGAGFLVVYCGDIMTMPGLPKVPAADGIDVNEQEEITGLY